MIKKFKKHRAGCAAILLASMAMPHVAFADQVPDLMGGEILVENLEGSLEESTGTDEVKLNFSADMAGVNEKDRKFKTTITFESYDDSDTGFNDLTDSVMVGNTKFILNSIDNLKMIDSHTPERRTMNITTDTFIKGTENEFLPDETMKKDGHD